MAKEATAVSLVEDASKGFSKGISRVDLARHAPWILEQELIIRSGIDLLSLTIPSFLCCIEHRWIFRRS